MSRWTWANCQPRDNYDNLCMQNSTKHNNRTIFSARHWYGMMSMTMTKWFICYDVQRYLIARNRNIQTIYYRQFKHIYTVADNCMIYCSNSTLVEYFMIKNWNALKVGLIFLRESSYPSIVCMHLRSSTYMKTIKCIELDLTSHIN